MAVAVTRPPPPFPQHTHTQGVLPDVSTLGVPRPSVMLPSVVYVVCSTTFNPLANTPPDSPEAAYVLSVRVVCLCADPGQPAAEVAECGHSEGAQGAQQEPVEGLQTHAQRVHNQGQPAGGATHQAQLWIREEASKRAHMMEAQVHC